MKTALVIVAAGRGHRLGGEVPKQYLRLDGHALLHRTVESFLAHTAIGPVQVVIHPDDVALYEAAVSDLSLLPPVFGGDNRQQSVRNGLLALKGHRPDLVLIHDAARPFASPGLIDAVISAAAQYGGAVPGLPVTDTLKRAAGQTIEGTADRTNLWRAQTPQGFRYADILEAHESSAGRELTDDAALFEALGHPVHLVPGEEDNFKITTAEDLAKATSMILRTLTDTRTGYGFDVHAFEPGDRVILGGIVIPHDRQLKGHSDADVALHALTDALLGALAAGDIGDHFPPGDSRWKGAASDIFLKEAVRLVRDRGGRIAHLDLTLICEAPKIGPHRDAMRENIARICDLAPSRVSVKATTTERLGFTGRREGIAAQAVATVRLPEQNGYRQ